MKNGYRAIDPLFILSLSSLTVVLFISAALIISIKGYPTVTKFTQLNCHIMKQYIKVKIQFSKYFFVF